MFTAAVFVLICLPGFPFILLTFTKFSFYSRLLYFHPGWNIFNLCRNFSCTGIGFFFFNSVYRVKTSTWNENLDIISSLVWVHGLWRTYLQYHRWVLCIEQSNFLVGTQNFLFSIVLHTIGEPFIISFSYQPFKWIDQYYCALVYIFMAAWN